MVSVNSKTGTVQLADGDIPANAPEGHESWSTVRAFLNGLLSRVNDLAAKVPVRLTNLYTAEEEIAAGTAIPSSLTLEDTDFLTVFQDNLTLMENIDYTREGEAIKLTYPLSAGESLVFMAEKIQAADIILPWVYQKLYTVTVDSVAVGEKI